MTLALAGGPASVMTEANAMSPGSTASADHDSWHLFGRFEIVIRVEEGQYVALESVTGMFGEGDTPHEAFADLIGSLYDHRNDLVENEPHLSAHLRGQLEVLRNSLPR